MELKMGGKNLIKSNRKVILEGMRDGLLLENLHTTDEKLPESLAEAAKVALASDFVAGVLPERLDSATLPFRFHSALPQKLRDLMRFKAFLQAFCATHRQVNIRALP